MSIMKNINKAKVMVLKDQVSYQEGQIVSKTLVQNESVSITLFAFDKESMMKYADIEYKVEKFHPR